MEKNALGGVVVSKNSVGLLVGVVVDPVVGGAVVRFSTLEVPGLSQEALNAIDGEFLEANPKNSFFFMPVKDRAY